MSEPRSNPRRRPLYKSSLPPLETSSLGSSPNHGDPSSCRRSAHHGVSLRKGATFHSPSSPPSEECDPVLNFPTLLRRSPTAPNSLGDVIAAGEKRMAAVLGSLERNISGLGRDDSSSSLQPADEDLPVPRGILDANIPRTDAMDTDTDHQTASKKPVVHSRHRHSSDSGLGTSISGTGPAMSSHNQGVEEDISPRLRSPKESFRLPIRSAVTRSISSQDKSVSRVKPTLGAYAFKQIEQHILRPLYKEKRLQQFHPLVKAVPKRVVNDEIQNLRDVEKHLLLTANQYTASAALFLNFCEYAIQCIHTTVPHLHDRDLRRPADRVYTNGYFLDLVEEMRGYAANMAASRQARAAGRESNSLDYSSGEELVLEGGLSNNGRRAQLVRKKGGRKISLETGAPYEEKPAEMPALKRSLSPDSGDDSVLRSMARRKKDAPPLDINKKCDHCDKVFRRPCDLTKHEKTHIRPWKCSEKGCKYFELGWPTEKERDRHMNDKHSKAPRLFKCSFEPCTYASKRQSNCKQHMEKAHGWVYHRSKNNGKTTSARPSAHPTPQSPMVNTPITGMTDIASPASAPINSPYTMSYGHPQPAHGPSPITAGNHQPAEDFQLFPNPPSAALGDNNAYDVPFDFSDFNNFHSSLQAGDRNDFLPSLDMHLPSVPSSTTSGRDGPSGALDQSPSVFDNFNYEIDWDNIDNEYTTLTAQLLTPAHSVQAPCQESFSGYQYNHPGDKIPTLSPGGQGNLMFYTPPEDEGFQDGYDPMQRPSGDFPLFDTSMDAMSNQVPSTCKRGEDTFAMDMHDSMFQPLHSVGEQYPNCDFRPMDIDDYMNSYTL